MNLLQLGVVGGAAVFLGLGATQLLSSHVSATLAVGEKKKGPEAPPISPSMDDICADPARAAEAGPSWVFRIDGPGRKNPLLILGTMHLAGEEAIPPFFMKEVRNRENWVCGETRIPTEVAKDKLGRIVKNSRGEPQFKPKGVPGLDAATGLGPDETLETRVGSATFKKIREKFPKIALEDLQKMSPFDIEIGLEASVRLAGKSKPLSPMDVVIQQTAGKYTVLESQGAQVGFVRWTAKLSDASVIETFKDDESYMETIKELRRQREADESFDRKKLAAASCEDGGKGDYKGGPAGSLYAAARNTSWLSTLANGCDVAAVGQAHLVCSTGLLAMFEKKGFSVTQLNACGLPLERNPDGTIPMPVKTQDVASR